MGIFTISAGVLRVESRVTLVDEKVSNEVSDFAGAGLWLAATPDFVISASLGGRGQVRNTREGQNDVVSLRVDDGRSEYVLKAVTNGRIGERGKVAQFGFPDGTRLVVAPAVKGSQWLAQIVARKGMNVEVIAGLMAGNGSIQINNPSGEKIKLIFG